MLNTVKVYTWFGAAVAAATVLLSLLVYSTDRAESATRTVVAHESRHVKVESDVERIDTSVKDHYQIIQSQLAAVHKMDILILEHVIKE